MYLVLIVNTFLYTLVAYIAIIYCKASLLPETNLDMDMFLSQDGFLLFHKMHLV